MTKDNIRIKPSERAGGFVKERASEKDQYSLQDAKLILKQKRPEIFGRPFYFHDLTVENLLQRKRDGIFQILEIIPGKYITVKTIATIVGLDGTAVNKIIARARKAAVCS